MDIVGDAEAKEIIDISFILEEEAFIGEGFD
jgi:hypothetical protein